MFSHKFFDFIKSCNLNKFQFKEIENIIFYFVLGDFEIIEDYFKFKKGLIDDPILDLAEDYE